MKTLLVVAVFTFVLLVAPSILHAGTNTRLCIAQWTDKPPVIDGKPDDPAWADAKELGGFVLLNGSGKPDVPTYVKVLTDGKSLYVGFRCIEPDMNRIKVEDRKRDDGTWMDDSVEVVIDPANDRKMVYHLIVNANGSMFDAACKAGSQEHIEENRSWSGNWEAAASKGSGEWYAEWRIPFETLGITSDTTPCCGVNFARARMGAKVELSSWSPGRNQFVNPACLGSLLVSLPGRSQCSLDFAATTALYQGNQSIDFYAANHSSSPVELRCTYALNGKDGKNGEIPPFVLKAGETRRIPTHVAPGSAGPYRLTVSLLENSTGKTLYTLSRGYQVPPVIEVKESMYKLYQGMAEAEIWVNIPASESRDASVKVSLLREGSFIPVESRTVKVPTGTASVVAFKLEGKPEGKYTIEAGLLNVKAQSESVRSHPMPYIPKPEVGFNKDGFMTLDNKPYFPVGIYTLQSKGGDHDKCMEEGRKAGFNTTVFYAYNTNDVLPLLDAAQRNDVKAFIYSTNPYKTRKGEATKEEITTDVKARMNHPALLGWYLVDEPEGIGETSVDLARNLYQSVKEVDGNHPCSLVIMSPNAAGAYAKCADVIWIDPYPVPNRPVTTVSDYVAGAVKAVGKDKPVWVVPQAFDWNVWHNGKVNKVHRPTPDEERCMTYLALVHGAKGLIYWAHTASRYYIHDYPEHWENVKKIAGELRDLSPVLLTLDSKRKVSISAKAPIDTMVKELDGNIYLFAVNREAEPCKTSFSISGYGSGGSVEVLFEDRTLASSSGNWEDEFKPLEVHLYKLTK